MRLWYTPERDGMRPKLTENAMKLRKKMGRGVYLLRPGEEVIYAADIPPYR